MRVDSSGPGAQSVVTHRAKQGVCDLWPESYRSTFLSLMRKQLVQIDLLAVEIRAAGGTWITRSGIIAAFIEAALRSEFEDLPATRSSSTFRDRLLKGGTPRKEERTWQRARRLRQLSQYLLQKRRTHR
jgi:hypothetical protein